MPILAHSGLSTFSPSPFSYSFPFKPVPFLIYLLSGLFLFGTCYSFLNLFLFLSSPFSRFSLVENNRAPSGLRIFNFQFSILHSQLTLPSGCNGCSMDDEWVPNGCSLGAPFTVLVRKLFFIFAPKNSDLKSFAKIHKKN